ncbi:MAG: porin [Candidatus Glassbacteria bacterium]
MKALKVILLLVFSFGIWSVAIAGEENVISKKSKLSLTGRVHAQFHTTRVEDYTPTSTFFVRRARLKAVYVNPSGTMKGVVQYDLGEGGAKLKDGYVDLKVNDNFKIKMGQFKKPFSLWELTSSTKIAVIERANKIMGSSNSYSSNAVIIKDGLYADRDLGVQAHGSADKVDWAVGIFNGNGNNVKHDDDSGKTFGGRVVYNIEDDLAIGGAVSNRMIDDYTTVSDTDTTVADENFQAFEVDLEYGIRHHVKEVGPWIQAEVVFGKNPHFGDTDTNFLGFMGVFSYNVLMENSELVHSLRPAFRFDWSKRNTDDDDTQTMLLTPGMDVFFDPNNRLQINLDVNIPNADNADTEFAIRTQFQMLI